MQLKRKCKFKIIVIKIKIKAFNHHLKKQFYRIKGDVRNKLKTLRFNIAFLDKMIDAMFLNNFMI